MVELKEIEKKKIDLEKQMEQLEKEKEKIMVADGKAFLCKNCKTFIDKTNISAKQMEHQLCYDCLRKKRVKELKKGLLMKLLEAKIVDIEIEGCGAIKSITAHRSGMMYKLEAHSDEDSGYINLRNEWKEEYRESESILRPGDKPRVEKPLPLPSLRK